MRVDQALYGPTRNGHSILKSTGDGLIAKEITPRMDLPDTAPHGVVWSDYLIGFPLAQHYVLGRTMLDTHASRTGMVFAHVLISLLDEMAKFDDLDTLITLLSTEPCPDKAISAIEVTSERLAAPKPTSEQMSLATLLVSFGKLPVVRLGCQGFDQIVSWLWGQLWPSMRRGLSFRMSFGPKDLVELPLPSLVCTPANLSSRWIGFGIVTNDEPPEEISLAAALLAGAERGRVLKTYASSLGVEIQTFANLSLLERAYELHLSAPSLDSSIALLRIIETLSSRQPSSATGKEEVVTQTLRFLANATAKQALSLRNLTLTSLIHSDRIWNALSEWMAQYNFPEGDDTEITQLLLGLDDIGHALPDWHRAIKDGLTINKSAPSSRFFKAFWRCGNISTEVYQRVFSSLPVTDADESSLVEAAPDQLATANAQTLLTLSESRRLYRLHGLAASSVFPPLESVRSQLRLDKENVSLAGIRLALRKAQPGQVVESALALHNSQLTELAGVVASIHPDVLADLDMAEITAQNIWVTALRENPACWNGPKFPEAQFYEAMNVMLDGNGAETPLITALSKTPLADLNGYTRRQELWESLHIPTKQRLIAATAEGWLKRVADGTASDIESEIQSHIISSPSFPTTVRRLISTSVDSALRLFSFLPSLTENRFIDVLPLITARTFDRSDADSLGRLLLLRHWRFVAEQLADLLGRGREDIRPVLRVCYSLLGLWRRFRLGLAPLSQDEKWQALAQVAADLYPGGPDHGELWRRAGGHNSDLLHHGDGRVRWEDALFKIRHGYPLRVSSLIARMKDDYPANDDLRYIGYDPEFQERN